MMTHSVMAVTVEGFGAKANGPRRGRGRAQSGRLIAALAARSWKNFAAKFSRLSSMLRFRAAAINRSNRSGSVLFGRFVGFVSAFAM
jgi:hypothetical protein